MGPDVSGLVDAVSTWAGVIVLAVLNVGAVLVVVSVALKGAKLVLRAVRGDSYWEDRQAEEEERERSWGGYTAEDDKRDRKAAGL